MSRESRIVKVVLIIQLCVFVKRRSAAKRRVVLLLLLLLKTLFVVVFETNDSMYKCGRLVCLSLSKEGISPIFSLSRESKSRTHFLIQFTQSPPHFFPLLPLFPKDDDDDEEYS